MTIKTVVVNGVDPAVKGRVVLHYQGTDGTDWKIGALESKLSNEAKANLKTIKAGETREIEVVKEGNFWNLTNVSAAGSSLNSDNSSATSTGTAPSNGAPYKAGPKTRSDTDIRIQVMNALTNAIVSLGGKAAVKDIESRVLELVGVGNNVIDRLVTGRVVAGTLTTKTKELEEACKEEAIENTNKTASTDW